VGPTCHPHSPPLLPPLSPSPLFSSRRRPLGKKRRVGAGRREQRSGARALGKKLRDPRYHPLYFLVVVSAHRRCERDGGGRRRRLAKPVQARARLASCRSWLLWWTTSATHASFLTSGKGARVLRQLGRRQACSRGGPGARRAASCD
jgi:hypothetical protein